MLASPPVSTRARAPRRSRESAWSPRCVEQNRAGARCQMICQTIAPGRSGRLSRAGSPAAGPPTNPVDRFQDCRTVAARKAPVPVTMRRPCAPWSYQLIRAPSRTRGTGLRPGRRGGMPLFSCDLPYFAAAGARSHAPPIWSLWSGQTDRWNRFSRRREIPALPRCRPVPAFFQPKPFETHGIAADAAPCRWQRRIDTGGHLVLPILVDVEEGAVTSSGAGAENPGDWAANER
jgi:hypothetical protein